MKLLSEISKCLCRVSACEEKGKVCWENDRHQYLHIRVNGCKECFNDLKRVDCVILRRTHDGETYAFIVEVKTKYYDLDEVKEKMENTLNVLDNILKHPLIPIPILYAESHREREKRYALTARRKVKYKGKAVPITFLKYCQKIQEAIKTKQ